MLCRGFVGLTTVLKYDTRQYRQNQWQTVPVHRHWQPFLRYFEQPILYSAVRLVPLELVVIKQRPKLVLMTKQIRQEQGASCTCEVFKLWLVKRSKLEGSSESVEILVTRRQQTRPGFRIDKGSQNNNNSTVRLRCKASRGGGVKVSYDHAHRT